VKSNSLWNKVFNKDVPLRSKFFYVANGAFMPLLCGPLNIVHIVEYPKCGGSWVRNMVRTYLGKDLFINDRFISSNEVILTHKRLTAIYRKPVVVVRDPRDMYVSFYHFETNYERRSKQSAISEFFTHEDGRPKDEDFYCYLKAKLLHPSHPWFFYSQFIDDWAGRPGTCLVRYEDCLKDAKKELIRIVRYLGEEVDLKRIADTVEETSFAAITSKKYGASRSAGDADNTKFHRKGIAGDWKNYFNRDSCELLEQMEGHVLRRLGYESGDGWIENYLQEKRELQA
jgi:hypothetical protein